MKLVRRILAVGLIAVSAVWSLAQESAPAASPSATNPAATDQAVLTNQAAAAAVATDNVPRPPDFLEHMVDVVLSLFDVKSSGNTATHYIIAALFLVGAFLLRHVVTTILFGLLKRLASKTETTLDDKLFGALEGPVATLISVAGAVAALKVLKLSETSDITVRYVSTVAFSVVILWGLLRAFGAILDHAQEVATQRQMGIAAFMPWIKKTLIVLFVIFGVLLIAQSLGADVKAFLAGLGIGGLAFALAAQDTIANVFGSVVVAIDQPFKVGETVQIGGNTGTVEDIGLRSTRIRKVDRSLVVIPNKAVAGENIVNLSRFNGRRVEQVLGLTYATTAAQMEELVAELRRMLQAEPEIDPASIHVYFRDFNSSSMDIWIAFNVKDPDFAKHMVLRQRLNLAYMRAIEARGLSMAFPTQTIHFDGEIAKRLAAGPRAAS
ncbi:MAG TPA: mechanosensitive ion channel family protein [Opitutaceae bacterium]|nr:mechanosensitive ion channel family protein [Opitutaceae bacterium]